MSLNVYACKHYGFWNASKVFSLSVSGNAGRGAGPSPLAFWLWIPFTHTLQHGWLVLPQSFLTRISAHMSVWLSQRCVFYRPVWFIFEEVLWENVVPICLRTWYVSLAGWQAPLVCPLPTAALRGEWGRLGAVFVTMGLLIPWEFCLPPRWGVAKPQDKQALTPPPCARTPGGITCTRSWLLVKAMWWRGGENNTPYVSVKDTGHSLSSQRRRTRRNVPLGCVGLYGVSALSALWTEWDWRIKLEISCLPSGISPGKNGGKQGHWGRMVEGMSHVQVKSILSPLVWMQKDSP